MKATILVFGSLLALVPADVHGQQGAAVPRAERCSQAIASVRGDASGAERGEAMRRLAVCGAEGGGELAREFRRLRAHPDRSQLSSLYAAMRNIRDASLFEAVLEAAADQSAPELFRITAFRVLVAYRSPGWGAVPLEHYLPGNMPRFVSVSDAWQLEGTPLAAGWHIEARSLLQRIAADPTEGEPMQHAARRALMFFRSD